MSAAPQKSLLRRKLGHISLPGSAGNLMAIEYLKVEQQKKLTAELVRLLEMRKQAMGPQTIFKDEQILFEADLTAALWRAAARFRLNADSGRCDSLKGLVPESIHAASSMDLHWADLIDTVSRLLTISRR
jgi:hypothetical protein